MEIPEEVWPAILKLSESAPSRRERIATACLIGLLGNPQWADIRRITVEEAILYADALIAELDKKEDCWQPHIPIIRATIRYFSSEKRVEHSRLSQRCSA